MAPRTTNSTIASLNNKKNKARTSVYLLAYNQMQNGLAFADVEYRVSGLSPMNANNSLS